MSLLHSIMRLKWTRWFGERHVSPRLCGRVHVFPGNSIGPFIFRVIWLIGRALPSDGGIFRGCTSGNFCDRYKYARAEGIEIFPPESKERRVCAFDDSYKGYRRLSSILIRKTTLSKELCDPILRQIVSKIVIFVLINRYIRKKKKMNYISKKKTSNSINDLWPRNLNRAISARFRFRYHLERF